MLLWTIILNRSYCVTNKKIDKKMKMTLTEKNVVEKWNQWFYESVRGEASDNDSN